MPGRRAPSRARPGLRARLASETGSAVVEFPLVAVLIVVISLAVIQAALIMHTRNSLVDAAVQAAHHAALHGNTAEDGERRAQALVDQRLGASYQADVSAVEAPDGRITVEITATMPLVGLLGPSGTLRASGHAVDEDTL